MPILLLSNDNRGLSLYEQDWLVTTYMEMNATQNNVDNARNWLLYMGNAASKLNLTIQVYLKLASLVLHIQSYSALFYICVYLHSIVCPFHSIYFNLLRFPLLPNQEPPMISTYFVNPSYHSEFV